ncbi:YopX family protein [Streptococcus uberis]|uniref:YopX family protein n=1 Tax=Streptococcus uberis TaxID=1349 RepID=UPI0021505F52|nr:YopX family protein [Streptococcus uberis]MCR4258774.1 YopX family protein [Streptococcus uberis]
MIPKFRGKSIDKSNKGKWVYGNLIVDGNNALIVNGIVECEEDYVALGDWCPVDINTIGQSTSPKDKNGVEIFEGDILEVTDTSLFGGSYRGAIEYLERWGVYGFSMLDAKVISTNEFDKHSIGFLMKEFGSCFTLAEASKTSNYSYKIIGNIYENPDLLESV